MNQQSQLALVKSATLGALLCVVLVVLLTIVGELYAPLKNHLASTLYHHWVGKGVWAVVLFGLVTTVGYPLYKRHEGQATMHLLLLNVSLVVGSVLLFAFYLYEYVIHH